MRANRARSAPVQKNAAVAIAHPVAIVTHVLNLVGPGGWFTMSMSAKIEDITAQAVAPIMQ